MYGNEYKICAKIPVYFIFTQQSLLHVKNHWRAAICTWTTQTNLSRHNWITCICQKSLKRHISPAWLTILEDIFGVVLKDSSGNPSRKQFHRHGAYTRNKIPDKAMQK